MKKRTKQTFNNLYWLNLPLAILSLVLLFFATPTVHSIVLGAVISMTGLFIRLLYIRNGKLNFYLHRYVRIPYGLGSFLLLIGIIIASRTIEIFPFALIFYAILLRKSLLTKEKIQKAFQVSSFFPQTIPSSSKEKVSFSNSLKTNNSPLMNSNRFESGCQIFSILYFILQYGNQIQIHQSWLLGVYILYGFYLFYFFVYSSKKYI